MKKDNKKTPATTTRNILATTLVIVIIGAIVGFYFGLQLIKAYALEVTHTVTDSHASGQNIEELSKLQQQLAAGQSLVAKADALFSTPATYQTQALKDISKYASDAGISISSIDSAKPATGAAATPDYSEIITIQSPVSYAKFLQFLDAIEGNLPKMQITGITIGRPTIPSGDLITTDTITVMVSTR
ncbi:MAG: hypothetical protein JWN12_315 [Candidatus Saccharibacteria bacterium]|nr:hypothetical protein [Candidatus Saccharibacteria bacterium]